GLLIDQAGLKGKRKGNAEISTKHANFIINTGKASAADILWLMEYTQEKVFKLFNINLEPEVKIVGD
ncbi:MAG: UDP-N-acetylmuramate dehydrogenase, partial [Desulfobacterales bacterium]|nr:UDP-N-acetylmuramate dehydrogenase [Desulfobacterales bacterium]